VGSDSTLKGFAYLPRLKNIHGRPNEIVLFELRDFLVPDICNQVADTDYACLEESRLLWATFRVEINVIVITVALVDQAPNC